MVRQRILLSAPFLTTWLLTGCFSPEIPAEDGATDASTGPSASGSSGGTGSTGVDPGETDPGTTAGPTGTDSGPSTSSQGTMDETAGQDVPPTIETFTVGDMAETPSLVVSGPYEVRVVATDDDGISSVSFYRDDALLGDGTLNDDGSYTLEWIVSGAVENGDAVIEVSVEDTTGLTSTAELIVDIELPNGGVVEGWDFDGGDNSSVWGISPTPDGDAVVWVGNFWNGQESLARIDRVDGPAWADVTANDSEFVIDARTLDGGGVLAAISLGTDFPRSTALRRFSAAGAIVETTVLDGGPDPSADNYPLGLETDSTGSFYVLGSFAGNTLSSYLQKVGPDLDLEWQRDITNSNETDGTPFVYDFDVAPDGTIALAGSRVAGARKLWAAVLSPDGSVVEQLTLTDEFPRSEGYDVTWTSDGQLVLTGATAASSSGAEDWRWIVRKYDADLNPIWTQTGANNTGFGQAVAADDFGNVISVVLETCDYNDAAFAYTNCRLVVRKRDSDGTLVWQYQGANGDRDFAGPALIFPGFKADVETDRFGYPYISALYQPANGSNGVWWATKHNP